MDREERIQYWAKHIECWKASGLTQRAYCEREAIACSTLQWWLRRRRVHSAEAVPHFVPVKVCAARAMERGEPIEVVLLSGRRLRFTAPRDEIELARLVRLLEVLPC